MAQPRQDGGADPRREGLGRGDEDRRDERHEDEAARDRGPESRRIEGEALEQDEGGQAEGGGRGERDPQQRHRRGAEHDMVDDDPHEIDADEEQEGGDEKRQRGEAMRRRTGRPGEAKGVTLHAQSFFRTRQP